MIWTILTIILTGIVLSLVFRPLRIKYAVLWKQFLKSGYYLRLSAYKTLHPARWYDVFALTVEIAVIHDSSGLNVPPVAETNVPGIAETNVPAVAE